MDAVRFGRALGLGARHAAKTVIQAVDAARAPDPTPTARTRTASAPTAHAPTKSPPTFSSAAATPDSSTAFWPHTQAAIADAPLQRAAEQAAARSPIRAGRVREGLSRFRDSAVEPAVRLSSVLWLEMMGVFFGLFALVAGNGLWRLRGEWRASLTHPAAHGSLFGAAAIFALFAYFSVSSFARARRRQRRR